MPGGRSGTGVSIGKLNSPRHPLAALSSSLPDRFTSDAVLDECQLVLQGLIFGSLPGLSVLTVAVTAAEVRADTTVPVAVGRAHRSRALSQPELTGAGTRHGAH
jgi:hypothetical protein